MRSAKASLLLITTENFDKPIDVWLARYISPCVELRFRHYARPEVNPGVRAAAEVEPLASFRAGGSSRTASSRKTLLRKLL